LVSISCAMRSNWFTKKTQKKNKNDTKKAKSVSLIRYMNKVRDMVRPEASGIITEPIHFNASYMPVDPNPPVPRSVSESVSASDT